MANAATLAAIGGVGTNCNAPLRHLNRLRKAVDLVVFVSGHVLKLIADGSMDDGRWQAEIESVELLAEEAATA